MSGFRDKSIKCVPRCQLWMGCLEPYMTESFILTAFRKMGENPFSVRILPNKFNGEPGYCFVHFANEEEAINAMHKLNSKPIPTVNNSLVRFTLNHVSNNTKSFTDDDCSVWVGDLSSDVDDYTLYKVFSSKYNTIKAAKVILDISGFSKGYGFVRFGSEEEMKHCLISMNGYVGLGTKALKLNNAVKKQKGTFNFGNDSSVASSSHYNGSDFSQYCDPSIYWQNYTSWQQHQYHEQSTVSQKPKENISPPGENTDDLELIEHTIPLDIEKLNREKIAADCNLWDALESSKWLPYESLEII